MIIRIHETDFDGRPVAFTGEYFHGQTARDIVSAMAMSPFTSGTSLADFMRATLERIGTDASLPADELEASAEFLRRLKSLGFAADAKTEPPIAKTQHDSPEMQMK